MDEAELIAHWDGMAGRFDRMIAPLERGVLGRARDWVCGRSRGDVLELAVGTGLNLKHYPPEVRLTGIEWSPAMLAVAAGRARSLGREVRLVRGDASRLPFAAASFDTVVCTLSLCCIPDDDAALVEAARVLRPGGRLLLLDHVASTVAPFLWAQRLLEHFTIPREGEHFTRRPLPKLAAHGLDVVESRRQAFGALERVLAVRRG